MYIRELSIEEFDNFTNSYPIKSIYQTSEYGTLMKNQGYNDIYIGLIKDEKIIGASLILIKKISKFKYAYAPKGYLIDYNDSELVENFTKLIIKYFSKMKIVAIKISPIVLKNIYDFQKQKSIHNQNYEEMYKNLRCNDYYHLGYNNFFEALKPRFEAIIDLNQSLDSLFRNITKKFRTKIRSAIINGVTVEKGNIDTLDYLYNYTKHKYMRNLDYFKDCHDIFDKKDMIDIYCTKLDAKKYLEVIQKKLEFYEYQTIKLNKKMLSTLIKNKQKIINKKLNNDKYVEMYKNKLISATNILRNNPDKIITSVAIIIKQDKEATILMDGYDIEYKSINSKHLLIWKLIETYKNQGYEKLNLGGMSNFVVDSKKYTGLNQFKLSFGCKMYEYAGDFEIITHKINYNLYRNYLPLKDIIKRKK